ANPHANGGVLLRDLRMPDFRDYAVEIKKPGASSAEATRVMGDFLRDIMKRNLESKNFRLFAPDELASNRLSALFDVTDTSWMLDTIPEDDHLSPDGRGCALLRGPPGQGMM